MHAAPRDMPARFETVLVDTTPLEVAGRMPFPRRVVVGQAAIAVSDAPRARASSYITLGPDEVFMLGPMQPFYVSAAFPGTKVSIYLAPWADDPME